MTWIKICGITNLKDARAAAEAGASALGFVFYEKSSRHVAVEAAREMVAGLPREVERVGVFVNEPADFVSHVAERVGLTAVQLHGPESTAEFVRHRAEKRDRSARNIKLIATHSASALEQEDLVISEVAKQSLYALLLDSGSASAPGGTGKTFDWEKSYSMVMQMSFIVPVIVAGGLTALNVDAAIRRFRPWGVDVASGVEAAPGKKDHRKLRAFVDAVRRAEEII